MFIKNEVISNFNCVVRCASCSVVVVLRHQSEAERRRPAQQQHKRQHRPACPPANAMGIHNGNAFAGTTANGLAVRRTPRRTTPACGAATDALRPGTSRHAPAHRGSPATTVATRGIFGATHVGVGNGRAPLASGAAPFTISKNKFLLISRVVFIIEISSCR